MSCRPARSLRARRAFPRVRDDAGVLQSPKDRNDIRLGQRQGKEVLAHKDVVVIDAPKRVPVLLSRILRSARAWPRGGS